MPAVVLTFVKLFIIYLPLAWILSRSIGITGIFWANAVSHLLLGAASLIWLRKSLAVLEAEDRSARRPASAEVTTLAGSNY